MNPLTQAKLPLKSNLLRVISALFIVFSPLVLYLAVTRFSARDGALVVAGWVVFRIFVTILARSRADIRHAIAIPVVSLVFALAGALAQSPRLLLLLPSLTQFSVASIFAASLRHVPLVERFARHHETALSPDEIAYCRTVTVVWSVFLFACGLAGLILAWFASPAVWAFFTGVGSYLLVALLFAGEYIFRQFRFPNHRFRDVRRMLRRFFPNT